MNSCVSCMNAVPLLQDSEPQSRLCCVRSRRGCVESFSEKAARCFAFSISVSFQNGGNLQAPSVVTKRMTCIRLMWGRRVGLGIYLSSSERGRPTILVLEICRTTNPITQLSDAKSPLMALHVPELRMMMPANESSADIPYWN